MVLRSELNMAESLVNKLILVISGQEATPEPSSVVLGLMAKECERLRSTWIHHLFSTVKETAIIRYVRFHQSGMSVLSDKLSDPFIQGVHAAELELVRNAALKQLDDLLQVFQNSLPNYFDMEMLESRYRRRQEQIVYQEISSNLDADLIQHLPGSALVTAIAQSIHQRLESFWTEPVSYRQSSTVYQFLVSLKYYLSAKPVVNERELFLFVYKLNLNTDLFFNWFKENVNNNSFMTAKEARQHLEERVRLVHMPFDPFKVSLEDMILPWLDGVSDMPGNRPGVGFTFVQMPLTLSVAQFSMFIRVCYRAGCFTLTNAAEIIRFFAANFTTKRQDAVSVKSFTKGFYAMDQTSAAVIRDFLQRMIALINKTYFS